MVKKVKIYLRRPQTSGGNGLQAGQSRGKALNSHQTIFVVNAIGELAQMRLARPSSEDALQDLVARFPGYDRSR